MSTRLSSAAATATAPAARAPAMASSSSPTLAPVSDSNGDKSHHSDNNAAPNNTNKPPTTSDHNRDTPVIFAVPKLPHDREHHHHQLDSHLPIPRTPASSSSLGWALHGGTMGAPEGFGLALSDTPAASAPSTAPGSPRM